MNPTNLSIGAQLYIFSGQNNVGWDATFSSLQGAGYTSIESFRSHELYKPLCAKYGLQFSAIHGVPSALQDLDVLTTQLEAWGVHDICSSGLLDWNARSADDYKATIEYLNQQGRLLRQRGIYLHYHNHDFEFEPVSGERTGMDLLIDGIDFKSVDLCLDAGWVWFAGRDVAQFLQENAAKLGFLHLRDFKAINSCALGQGDIDLAPIITAIRTLPNLRGIMVEQDPKTDDPSRDMLTSRRYLSNEFGL